MADGWLDSCLFSKRWRAMVQSEWYSSVLRSESLLVFRPYTIIVSKTTTGVHHTVMVFCFWIHIFRFIVPLPSNNNENASKMWPLSHPLPSLTYLEVGPSLRTCALVRAKKKWMLNLMTHISLMFSDPPMISNTFSIDVDLLQDWYVVGTVCTSFLWEHAGTQSILFTRSHSWNVNLPLQQRVNT